MIVVMSDDTAVLNGSTDRTSAGLNLPLIVLAVMIAAGLGGLAFYGWISLGSSMFLTLAQTGLAWCM
jgi:hypothetical protein